MIRRTETHLTGRGAGNGPRSIATARNPVGRSRLGIALMALLAAATAHAAPLARNRISADAKWLLHLDIEQFAPSQTCRLLLQDPKSGGRLRNLLDNYRNLLGTDPLKSLSFITLYGEQVTGNRGVAIVGGAIDAKTLVSRLAAYPGYSRRKTSRSTIHRWKDKASGADFNACLYESGLLVITSDDTSMDSALGTLTGARPNLASRQAAPALSVPATSDGSFLVAASAGYAGESPHPLKAMLLRNTTCAAMQVAESKGMMDASIAMDAVSPDAAFQIHQVVNGLIVSAALADEASGLARLAELSEVTRRDRQVMLRLHCPARDAASALAATLLSR